MATSTLSHEYDKNAATEDWRTGVVELPPDHVYGKTALTEQEWRRRAHSAKGAFIVVLDAFDRRVTCTPRPWTEAAATFRIGLDAQPSPYHPHGRMRLSVMTQDEWKRVNGGDR